MKRIYISGPMTGKTNLNREAFAAAKSHLLDKGYRVVNPVELGDALEITGALEGLEGEDLYMAHLRNDLAHVPGCDEIYMMRGWEESGGYTAEFALARICRLKVRFEK